MNELSNVGWHYDLNILKYYALSCPVNNNNGQYKLPTFAHTVPRVDNNQPLAKTG